MRQELDEEKPLVLAVDDVAPNLQVLRDILKNVSCKVSVATNGCQALDIAEKITPALILLDIMMPEMDGYETCERLKKNDRTKNIPIIFLTAKNETSDIVKAFEKGAVDYLTKPFNSAELIARVQTQLTIKRQQDALFRQYKEQGELLHVLCHDLANPIGGIYNFMELFANGAVDRDELVEMSMPVIKNMMDIIELVRNMRRLETKNESFALVESPLNQLLQRSLRVLGNKFEQKNVLLNVDVSDRLTVVVEPVSFINSVINNLLTNALKFSFPDSEILIAASQNDEWTTIRIVDHGIGIPPVILENLFNLKKKTSREGTSGEMGTGFGMPLVKKFIDAYGGSLSIVSTEKTEDNENHGTEVSITVKSTLR